jgi:hypothetical protein
MEAYQADRYVEIPPVQHTVYLGGVEVNLGGYIHSPQYFEAYREDIKRHVQGATVLVIEQAYLAESSISERAREVLDASESGTSFFIDVERIAHTKGVPVVSNDPYEHPRIPAVAPMTSALEERDLGLIELKVNVVLSALAITAGSLGLDIYELAKKRLVKALPTRRTVLVGGASALVASMSAASLYGTFINNRIYAAPFMRRANSPVGPFLFDAEDYRDVATAYTIATLARDLPRGSRIASVYGVGHIRSIKHYLEHREELAIKRALYMAAFGETVPKSIVFSPQGVEENGERLLWRPEAQSEFTDRLSRASAR